MDEESDLRFILPIASHYPQSAIRNPQSAISRIRVCSTPHEYRIAFDSNEKNLRSGYPSIQVKLVESVYYTNYAKYGQASTGIHGIITVSQSALSHTIKEFVASDISRFCKDKPLHSLPLLEPRHSRCDLNEM